MVNTGNRDFNSNLYRIIMSARFAADGYRERQVTEQQVAPSGVDLSQLSSEEREQLAVLLTKAKVKLSSQPCHSRPGSGLRQSRRNPRGCAARSINFRPPRGEHVVGIEPHRLSIPAGQAA